ncbi:DUF3419 family protein [Thalassococcus sp. S3]|uniref:DUF3419 family protein n=1 Tax=Thalassococcus sp. S3 TaxID=2017482 RepID=UPI0010243B65|nr:DUF3419 family protein [Thalassococcus sp. S3]QBF33887.1 S-adenosylmethionine--diacylglycerol 3-amino-3-carboxypropyl transferase [Thalassococcus sp. S3]
MTYTASIEDQLGAAVHQNPALSKTGALERVFSHLFQGLVYAQIWEDPVADMQALQIGPEDQMVCIASGGCNVMSYLTANPASITAVDLSPAHIALLRLKLAGAERIGDFDTFYRFFGKANHAANVGVYDRVVAPHLDGETRGYWEGGTLLRRRISLFERTIYHHGLLGRFIGGIHVVGRLAGVNFREFVRCSTLEAQRAFFGSHVDPLFDRWIVMRLAQQRASLFGLGIPPAQYDKLAADGGGDVIPVLRERIRKLMCDFPVSENYFAWQAFARGYAPDEPRSVPPYLERGQFETVKANARRVRAHNRSLIDLLASLPDGSRDVYVLLDAQDWMTDDQLANLWAEITRTARPGARVLFRTGGINDILPGRVAPDLLGHWKYDAKASAKATADDRSAIYGAVHLYRMANG